MIIEGLDRTGKSSLAKILGGDFIEYPKRDDPETGKFIDEFLKTGINNSGLSTYELFFRNRVNNPAKNSTRSFISGIVYELYRNPNADLKELLKKELVPFNGSIQPIIYLDRKPFCGGNEIYESSDTNQEKLRELFELVLKELDWPVLRIY